MPDVPGRPGVALRICSAEGLFALKAFADRLQDRADILGIARRRARGYPCRRSPVGELQHDPRDRRRQLVGHGRRQHGPKPESGQVVLAAGRQGPDAADLDAHRGDVGEPG